MEYPLFEALPLIEAMTKKQYELELGFSTNAEGFDNEAGDKEQKDTNEVNLDNVKVETVEPPPGIY